MLNTSSEPSCSEWLKKYLGPGGFGECTGIREDAKEAGFSVAELKAARKALGIKTHHQIDHDEEPFIDNWFWCMPKDRP